MRQRILSISIIAVLAITLSACHSMPEHAKYIPKDAVAVVSVDISAMGKKMAWSAITGSKIFDEWKAHPSEKDAMKGIDNAGIDYMNTLYAYTKKDERFGGGLRITGLIPLDDAAKFETFLKKNFPTVTVKEQGKRKEAMINEHMYAGWDSKLLVIINANANEASTMHFDNTGDTMAIQHAAPIDAAVLSAEMEKAFTVTKENELISNKHFMALQKEGHDISIWVNNDNMMNDYMGKEGASMSGLSLSSSLWKDAAFTTGFDFNKGSVKSEMKYYMPVELKDIAHELGSGSVDKEMVERLPTNNLDLVASWHMSPKGLKMTLEKTGVLGLANIAMASQNLTVDDVLSAFTGDMGFTMNDFAVTQTQMASESIADSNKTVPDYKTSANYVFVIKINKKENFNKLIQMGVTSQVLQSTGNNIYTLKNAGPESPMLMINDKYAVVSNKAENATAYLNSGNKGPKLTGLASESVTGHPLGMFFDVQQMVKSVDPAIKNNDMDPKVIAEAKKLVENMAMSGGEYKNDAFEWNMSMNFVNKDENSLIQILNFAMHMSDAQNKGTTAYNSKKP